MVSVTTESARQEVRAHADALEARLAKERPRKRAELAARQRATKLAREAKRREEWTEARDEQRAWEAAQQTVARRKTRAEFEANRAKEARRRESSRWGVNCRNERTRFKRPVGRHSLRREDGQQPIFADVEPVEFDAEEVNEALGEDALLILAIGLESMRRHGNDVVRLKLGRLAIELGDEPTDLRRVNKALRLLTSAGLHRWAGQRWVNTGGREPVRCHCRAFGQVHSDPDGDIAGGSRNLNSAGQPIASDDLRAWAADRLSRSWGGRRAGAGRKPKTAARNQDSELQNENKCTPSVPFGNLRERAGARSARGASRPAQEIHPASTSTPARLSLGTEPRRGSSPRARPTSSPPAPEKPLSCRASISDGGSSCSRRPNSRHRRRALVMASDPRRWWDNPEQLARTVSPWGRQLLGSRPPPARPPASGGVSRHFSRGGHHG